MATARVATTILRFPCTFYVYSSGDPRGRHAQATQRNLWPIYCLQLSTLRLCDARDVLDEGIERRCAQVFVRAQAHGDGIVCLFAVANDEHVGNLLQLRVAHFGVHALAARIHICSYADSLERGLHAAGIL